MKNYEINIFTRRVRMKKYEMNISFTSLLIVFLFFGKDILFLALIYWKIKCLCRIPPTFQWNISIHGCWCEGFTYKTVFIFIWKSNIHYLYDKTWSLSKTVMSWQIVEHICCRPSFILLTSGSVTCPLNSRRTFSLMTTAE